VVRPEQAEDAAQQQIEERADHGAAFSQIGLPASRRDRVCVPHARTTTPLTARDRVSLPHRAAFRPPLSPNPSCAGWAGVAVGAAVQEPGHGGGVPGRDRANLQSHVTSRRWPSSSTAPGNSGASSGVSPTARSPAFSPADVRRSGSSPPQSAAIRGAPRRRSARP
jgi:hypothetical protein